MKTTIQSYFWPVFWACIFGSVLVVGLLLELFAEKKSFKNVSALRFWNSAKKVGEWIVIIGVIGEVVVAGITAVREWRSNPMNQSIVSVSATAFVEVKGHIFNEESSESLAKRGLLWVAYLKLHDMSGQTIWLAPHFLTTDSFKKEFFSADPNASFNNSDRAYSLKFELLDFVLGITNASASRKVNEIERVSRLDIHAMFLPGNSEILGGRVLLTLNSEVQKTFQIPPQKDLKPSEIDTGVLITATNASQATISR